MKSTQQNSNSSGQPTHTGEVPSGMLSEDSRRQLDAVFQRAKSSQPLDDSIPSFFSKRKNHSTFHTPQPGSMEDAGSQLTTRKNPTPPPLQLSRPDRRQQNLHDERWRIGFGHLMIATSSAFNRVFGKVDLNLWANALAEYDIEDLTAGFADFIKSPEGFPTPGKAETFIKKRRQQRLGIVIR